MTKHTLALLLVLFTFTAQETHAKAPVWVTDFCARVLTVAGRSDRAPEIKTPITEEPVSKKPGQRKVLVLSSGFGMGHNSTAKAVETAVKAKDPDALITTIEVEQLQPEWLTRAQKYVFWTVVKKFPWFYDVMYAREMKKVIKGGIETHRKHIKPELLEAYVMQENADVIVAVHQGTAAELAIMKKNGKLKNTKIGFVMTDYMVEFYPEISKHVDLTFVAHPKLEAAWQNQGVPAKKVAVTGMPVNPEAFKPVDRAQFLKDSGLDPNVTTITLASGGEGVGNYPLIVKSLAAAYAGKPLQIVAICGKNETHVKNLTKLKPLLKQYGVELVVKGFTKHPEMFGFIKSSDLYITKSGGLSPAEGFAMGKPMILLDVYGGHERVNAKFFEDLGVATINRDQGSIGAQAQSLIADQAAMAKMLEAQKLFTSQLDFTKISDFVGEKAASSDQ